MITMDQTKTHVRYVLQINLADDPPSYGPNDAVSPDFTTPYPPDLEDLSRLYRYVRDRKVTTILEFGSGYSSAVMAQALSENRADFADTDAFKALRRNNPFEIHSIDCDAQWVRTTESRILREARDCSTVHVSSCSIGTWNGRICHFYNDLPNVCPDFIYLDGPFQHDVAGDVRGVHFRHNDRTVVAADILAMEWLLLPGCMILVDGRTNNARFLRANLQRNWTYLHDREGDVHIFELVEPPLGDLNARQIAFCLGEDALARYEAADV